MKRQRTFPSSSWRSLLLHVWLLLHCTVAGFRTSRRIFFSRYANVDSAHDVEAASSSTPTNSEKSFGSIFLVGAGPGDPELLTVGAAKILADERRLVIADRLVSREVLALVRGELRVARKLPGCAEIAQQEIYRWTEEAVRAGKDVVRLKIGDPFVFGRGGEEILEFRERLGVEASVVPGVSAVFSSPLLGKIPVTHRAVASQVVMSTGYGKEYARPSLQSYHQDQAS